MDRLTMTDPNTGTHPRIVVAILDGPVDLAHPCFLGVAISEERSVARGGGDTAFIHGTQIASIIAQSAPHTSIVSIPIYSSSSDGRILPVSQLDLARALNRALDVGAHIINISGGQLVESPHVDPRLESALKSCASRDILLIAAVGNDACDCIHVPAAVPSTLAVGAMDDAGQPLDFSNWGEAYRDHGVLAPGKDISVALPGGGSTVATGTSYAAAVVAGKAAVLMGELVHLGQRPSGKRIRDAILASAVDCSKQEAPDCRRLLSGRFNPAGALSLLRRPEPPNAGTEPHASPPPSLSNERVASSSDATPAPKPTPALKTNAGAGARLTYALGRIGVDFGNEPNRDSFVQRGVQNPEDAAQFLKHLEQEPWAAEAVTWTLLQDTVPIYAIRPAGAFASRTYEQLAAFLGAQLQGKVEVVAIPGYSGSSAVLFNGRTVPILNPNPRGIASWKSAELVQSVTDKHGPETAAGLSNFIERVMHELRNLGTSPEERALNFVATQAINHAGIFADAIGRKMTLDSSDVTRSPVCRPGSDCWDVKVTFFNPAERLTQARHVYRITVDVSGPLPVRVGETRHWDVF
jgi:cyclic patellamide precursor peptide PatG/subtilase family protein